MSTRRSSDGADHEGAITTFYRRLAWLGGFPAPRVAVSSAEREAIYRFRYDTYVREQREPKHPETDHHRGWLHSAQDLEEDTRLIYVGTPDRVLGALRLQAWRPGRHPGHLAQCYGIGRIDGIAEHTIGEINMLMVSPGARGSWLMLALTSFAVEVALDVLGCSVALASAAPGLLRHYRRLGMCPFGASPDPDARGILCPVICPADLRFLRRHRALWYPAALRVAWRGRLASDADTSAIVHAIEGDDAAVMDDEANAASLEARFPGGAGSSLLSRLSPAAQRALSANGVMLTVPRGCRLTVEGVLDRELFLVVDGELVVSRGGRALSTIRAGELSGEVAFFGRDGRRSATICAREDCRILVLRRNLLRHLRRSDPALCAELSEAILQEMAERIRSFMWAPLRRSPGRPLSGAPARGG